MNRGKRMANMKEIAQIAGVSLGTVSHVLNATVKVREPLRKRVLDAVAKTGYQPSQLARGLRKDKTNILAMIIPELGPFELLCDSDPTTGIPTVTWRIREGEDPGYTLFDLADRLRMTGWQVPAYTLTGAVSDIPVQRILVRQGVSRDLASLLIADMRDAIAHFDKHPVTVSMTKEESSGFSHL